MENTIKCLDHGFVKLKNISGPTRRTDETVFDMELDSFVSWPKPFDASDRDPAQTARISFNNLHKQRTENQDLKLYEYLIKNHHTTPIEMIETWWEMKLPIFLARQFIRHRTACVNEISARYSVLSEEWYIPEIVGGKSTNGAKQGQENNLSNLTQEYFKQNLNATCKESYRMYKYYIEEGVAPEHVRLFLHVNHYTSWVWKQDLHNLMHFLSLRLHEHAQIEARIYAQAMYDLLKIYLPKSMEYFSKYRQL